MNFPIELNNAAINGRDEEEDILTRTGGVLIEGTTGGQIEHLSLIAAGGGTVFNLNDPTGAEEVTIIGSLIEDSGSVGSLSGFEHIYD